MMVATRAELREQTRQSVRAAAAELFQAKGFHATTVRDIAATAGVSVGSVMAVGDKNSLLVDFFDGVIGAMHSQRAGIVPHASDPVDRIAELVDPFVDLFAANRDLASAYSVILVGGRHPSQIFGVLGEVLVAEFSGELVGQGWAAARANDAATTIYLAYLGLLFRGAGNPEQTANDLRTQLRTVITFAIGTRQ